METPDEFAARSICVLASMFVNLDGQSQSHKYQLCCLNLLGVWMGGASLAGEE
jgi:hypothetical protein